MKRFIAALLLCLLMTMTGCGGAKSENDAQLQFYYCVSSDVESGAAIQSESDTVKDMTVPGLLNHLFQVPVDPDLVQTIPEGTSIRSWSVSDGLLTLDLSEEFGKLSGVSLIRAEYCIVLTVSQLDTVKRVQITVEGRRLPENGNRTLSASDVIFQGETDDPVTVGITLYYPLSDGSGLDMRVQQMELASLNPVDQANAVLHELALPASEQDERYDSFLSGMSTLEAVSVSDGLCTVSMNHNALKEVCASDSSEQQIRLRIYAIVDSLTELESVDEVSFRLEGESIDGWQSVYSAQYEF